MGGSKDLMKIDDALAAEDDLLPKKLEFVEQLNGWTAFLHDR
jgi:hypothetical protein